MHQIGLAMFGGCWGRGERSRVEWAASGVIRNGGVGAGVQMARTCE